MLASKAAVLMVIPALRLSRISVLITSFALVGLRLFFLLMFSISLGSAWGSRSSPGWSSTVNSSGFAFNKAGPLRCLLRLLISSSYASMLTGKDKLSINSIKLTHFGVQPSAIHRGMLWVKPWAKRFQNCSGRMVKVSHTPSMQRIIT